MQFLQKRKIAHNFKVLTQKNSETFWYLRQCSRGMLQAWRDIGQSNNSKLFSSFRYVAILL
jgi:hypothetical protein